MECGGITSICTEWIISDRPLHLAATTARGDVPMYRDFVADRSVGADEHSSTCRESAGTVLKSFHVASATAEPEAEAEAELIMRRLVRNYLERSPVGP